MKRSPKPFASAKLALLCYATLAGGACADPLTTSWLTQASGQYARIYASEADRRAGRTSTTWENFHQQQLLPAYCGVQEILVSPDWVYVRTTGLGAHVMGPWFQDASRSRPFINLPQNQQRLFRIPRHPVMPAEKYAVRGDIGYFVDGVHGFDASDAVSYSAYYRRDGDPPGHPNGIRGDRLWNRDAYMNERVTFDAALAHQQNTGDYHYHANPLAPRFALGDHVERDAATGAFRESSTPPSRHSPIVGWARDGFPIYGPYGYSRANDPASGVRRMVSGFVRRDGFHGTTALATAGRTTLPAWAVRASGHAAALSPAEHGPKVSAGFPLGRYLEDNDYLGDLGGQQGRDFELDECNGRTCVTPEFPAGTYAYFATIDAHGDPAFPYNLGRRYHGQPLGGEVREVAEPVTTVFAGGPSLAEKIISSQPAGSEVTLSWSSVEGGTYRVETGEANAPRTVLPTVNARAAASTTQASVPAAPEYRVIRTALAEYDPVTRTGGGSALVKVSPARAHPGSRVTLTLFLDPAAFPPPPHAPVLSVEVGELAATQRRHLSHREVTAELSIPAESKPGPRSVSVTFPGPPDNPRDEVTYTLAGAFSIDAEAQ